MNFDIRKSSLMMGISTKSGVWSEERQISGDMRWLSSSGEPFRKNIRSRTEFASPGMLEYLVGHRLVAVDKVKLNESAIINRLLLIVEW